MFNFYSNHPNISFPFRPYLLCRPRLHPLGAHSYGLQCHYWGTVPKTSRCQCTQRCPTELELSPARSKLKISDYPLKGIRVDGIPHSHLVSPIHHHTQYPIGCWERSRLDPLGCWVHQLNELWILQAYMFVKKVICMNYGFAKSSAISHLIYFEKRSF